METTNAVPEAQSSTPSNPKKPTQRAPKPSSSRKSRPAHKSRETPESHRSHPATPHDTRATTPLDTRHPTLDTTAVHPRRSRGRPTLFTEELADSIYDAIRFFGLTDTAAAADFGVTASTISRWKRDDENLAADFEAARVEFKKKAIQRIWTITKRDGSDDWRAVAWLLERTFPDEFGRATRKPKPAEPEEDNEQASGFILTPEELTRFQKRREAAMREYAQETNNGTIEDRLKAHYQQLSGFPLYPDKSAPAPNPENIAKNTEPPAPMSAPSGLATPQSSTPAPRPQPAKPRPLTQMEQMLLQAVEDIKNAPWEPEEEPVDEESPYYYPPGCDPGY